MHTPKRPIKLQIQSPLELAIRGVLRHPVYLVAAVVVAAVAAGAAAHFLQSNKYNYTGKILYVSNKATEPYYVPPDLRNLAASLDGSELLKEIYGAFEMEDDIEVFKRRLKLEVLGESSMKVAYVGKDEAQVRDIVQLAMERFIARARELKSQTLDQHLADVETELVAEEDSFLDMTTTLQDLLVGRGFQSSESLIAEITTLRQAVSDYRRRIETALDRKLASQRQAESLSAMLAMTDLDETEEDRVAALASTNGVPSDENASSSGVQQAGYVAPTDKTATQRLTRASLEADADAVKVGYDMQMRILLEDRLRREKELASFQVELENKRKEYDRAKALNARKLISDAAFEKTRGELELLLAQQSEQVQDLEVKLDQLNARIKDRTANLVAKSPLAANALLGTNGMLGKPGNEEQTLAMLRGSERAADGTLEFLQAELKDRQDRLLELSLVRKEADPLIEEIDEISSGIDRLRIRKETFSQANRADTEELVIAQDSQLVVDGVRNNLMTIFAAGLVGFSGLLIGPLFLVKLRDAAKNQPGGSSMFGLPVVGVRPSRRRAAKDPTQARLEARRLALRTLQRLDDVAPATGFQSRLLAIAGGDQDADLIQAFCDQAASLGQTTMVLRGDELGRQRLHDAVIQSPATQHAGPEVSGSPDSTEVANDAGVANPDYVFIPVPLSEDPLTTETICSQADAVVLTPGRGFGDSPSMQRVIAELHSLEKPILGVIKQA
ncbi:MAG: hypothetical protein AAGD07_23455 [Planctomycetota bacterium]